MCHHQNPKYWEMDFVPSIDLTSYLWEKRNSKSDNNRFWKTASRAISNIHSSPKSNEDGNHFCLQTTGVIISVLGWHGCQGGGAESLKPCLSPSPRACSNSYPLGWWCHPTISSSVVPFSSCPQSFPASGSFPMSWLFESAGQSIGASVSVLPVNIQAWFPLNPGFGVLRD